MRISGRRSATLWRLPQASSGCPVLSRHWSSCFQVIFIAAVFAGIINLNELSATKLVSVIAILLVVGIALGLYTLVMPIIAAVRTSNGENYRYPLTLRLVK